VTFICGNNHQIVQLPLVESVQTQSQCDWVVGPLKHQRAKALFQKIERYLRNLDYIGAISFELFDTGLELLVNEVAPRVHNSAHYSMDALRQSQFRLHLLAGLGEKLPAAELLSPAFCMVNLVGKSHELPEVPYNIQGQLHWYGKNDNRPGRKMGHVNYVGTNSKNLLKIALSERKKFKL